jgi:hypothetical protein
MNQSSFAIAACALRGLACISPLLVSAFAVGCGPMDEDPLLAAPDPEQTAVAEEAVVGGAITRTEVLNRAQNWYNRKASLTYNSSRAAGTLVSDVDGAHFYGPDCSGYVSMAWHLNPGSAGGLNTSSLPSVSIAISRSDLKPGDILDYPAQHVILFDAWEADHVHFSYYSFGSTPLVHVTHVSFNDSTLSGWPTANYQAYRYKSIVDDSGGVVSSGDVHTFADIDGDGKDERIQIKPNGEVWAWANANGLCGYNCTYSWASIIAIGFTDTTNVRFADIDGDGKAEIIQIKPNGEVWAWANANGLCGYNCTYSWASTIATGFTDTANVRFADINGDKKAEIIQNKPSGEVRAWANANGLCGYNCTYSWESIIAYR